MLNTNSFEPAKKAFTKQVNKSEKVTYPPRKVLFVRKFKCTHLQSSFKGTSRTLGIIRSIAISYSGTETQKMKNVTIGAGELHESGIAVQTTIVKIRENNEVTL